jgi:hypothetical protein
MGARLFRRMQAESGKGVSMYGNDLNSQVQILT